MQQDLHRDHNGDDSNESMTITVDMDASVEQVWQALTTDAGLAAWMGQGATIQNRPGGILTLPDIATGRPRQGFIERIEPGESLAYRWWPTNEPDATTTVAISVEEIATGTRVTVVETAPKPTLTSASASASASRTGAAWAWRTALLTLAVHLVVTH